MQMTLRAAVYAACSVVASCFAFTLGAVAIFTAGTEILTVPATGGASAHAALSEHAHLCSSACFSEFCDQYLFFGLFQKITSFL